MPKPPEISYLYAFADFRLEAAERRLRRGETPVSLTPKTFDLLLFLVESEGKLLRKEHLLASVWPDAAVEENNLTVGISALRKALGENKRSRFIETVPKIGYRFVAQVTKLPPDYAGEPLRAPAELAAAPESVAVEPSSAEPVVSVTRFAPAVSDAVSLSLPRKKSKVYRWGLVAAAVAGLATFIVLLVARGLGPKHVPSAPRRLAILPFRNLRGNVEDEFLALSLANAVITRLGSIQQLTVRPLYDIQRYTTESVDLAKVAADLVVDAVLTGTFIHEEDELRITGQLVDVKTHDILWSGGFDVKYKKLLTVQEIVAKQIVQGLRLTVSKTEAASIKASETIDPAAYEYYLRGIDLYAKNEFQLASRVLEKSVELAPNHAASWASLGRAYTANASFEFGGDEAYRKAEAAFRRAIALEPNAMDARVYMANMFTDSGRVEKAVPLLREAVRVNPRHAESHWELGYAYRFAGMLKASVSECERARQLDPAVKRNSSTLNSYIYLGDYGSFLRTLPKTDDTALIAFYKGFAEYYLKQEQQAIADFDHAYELDPFILQSRVGKALSHSLRHQNARARTVLRALEQRIIGERAYDPEAVYKVAEAYAVAGDKTSALRMLRRSVETGFFPYPYLSADPLLNNLRREKEFSTLLDAARRRHEAFQKMFF